MATLTFSLGFLKSRTSACPLHDHHRRRSTTTTFPRRTTHISCDASGRSGDHPPSPPLLDRRDVLVALGGLYGSATAKPALANPVAPPDLSKCHIATDPRNTEHPLPPEDLQCCPPQTVTSSPITDYTFPTTPLRVRRPIHLAATDKVYVDKLQTAIAKMKALDKDPDDPWSFINQSKIHCAYCNSAYDQVGVKEDHVPINVHGSWLFLPWHRYYVHFYERILGKLIEDDTFALPYWNWDSPDGMAFPSVFNDPKLVSLYNPNRNQKHVKPPAVVDYQYGYAAGERDNVTPEQVVQENVEQMRTAFKQSLPLAELFMGDPLRAGEIATNSTGRLESIHNSVHQWVGPPEQPHADMGNFITAAKDISFWALHTNVDRLWSIYHSLRGNQVEFNDRDWLDASFLFYDEDRKLVKVKLRDTLNTSKFCYTYEDVPIPWLTKAGRKKRATPAEPKKAELVAVPEFGKAPRRLVAGQDVRVVVKRPKKNRSVEEKKDQVEVLFVEGIQVNTTGPARFDVYVSRAFDGDAAGKEKGDLAGSYVKLPHSTAETVVEGKGAKVALLKLGLTAVVEDLGADDAENLVITLRPRFGDVTVSGVSIKLLDTDAIATIA